jgi:uracil-DNA glycosylase family 4
VFTGDRSGDFLFAALHRAGFASQSKSVARDDGLRLADCYIAPLARCAPPANKPTPEELRNCCEYLAREWRLLRQVRAVLALGKLALDGFVGLLREEGRLPVRKAYEFGHGVSHDLGDGLRLFASYHPSQQNTFTGKLTTVRFDAVFAAINRHLGQPAKGAR